MARGAITAWVGCTFIEVLTTCVASEAIDAEAGIVTHVVKARASVETRSVGTVVDVLGALPSLVSQGTLASVGAGPDRLVGIVFEERENG